MSDDRDARSPADTTPCGVMPTAPPALQILRSLQQMWRRVWRSPGLRLLFVALTCLLLMVPVAMVRDLHGERVSQRDAAAIDISRGWGAAQTVQGPWLSVPYSYVETAEHRSEAGQVEVLREEHHGVYHVMLDQLVIEGELDTETRSRGIFDVSVYLARLRAHGRIELHRPQELPEDAMMRWADARLLLGVSDVTAIRGPIIVEVGGVEHHARPLGGRGPASVEIALALTGPGQVVELATELTLGGTRTLEFVPMADDFRVNLTGDWASPAFRGTWLPVRRDVSATGFHGEWSVPSLARGTASAWRNADPDSANVLGVELLPGVDAYRQIERSLKYATLLIGLTLTMLWLFELRTGRLLRPIQYFVTGGALALFFLLELSLSEHLGFAWAYASTALLISTMQADYARGVLGSLRKAAWVWACHLAVYAGLFIVLSHEDYALLGGSMMVTGMAFVAMRSTRTLAGMELLDDEELF